MPMTRYFNEALHNDRQQYTKSGALVKMHRAKSDSELPAYQLYIDRAVQEEVINDEVVAQMNNSELDTSGDRAAQRVIRGLSGIRTRG